MSQYQGNAVTVMRDAGKGDPGFNGTEGQQVIIKLKDGSLVTVLRTEVTGDPTPAFAPSRNQPKPGADTPPTNNIQTENQPSSNADPHYPGNPPQYQGAPDYRGNQGNPGPYPDNAMGNPGNPGNPTQYPGNRGSILRDAKAGDQGYEAGKDQVWVRNADGTESIALRSNVK